MASPERESSETRRQTAFRRRFPLEAVTLDTGFIHRHDRHIHFLALIGAEAKVKVVSLFL